MRRRDLAIDLAIAVIVALGLLLLTAGIAIAGLAALLLLLLSGLSFGVSALRRKFGRHRGRVGRRPSRRLGPPPALGTPSRRRRFRLR
jgi:uncharacterized protein (DUF58 family)